MSIVNHNLKMKTLVYFSGSHKGNLTNPQKVGLQLQGIKIDRSFANDVPIKIITNEASVFGR